MSFWRNQLGHGAATKLHVENWECIRISLQSLSIIFRSKAFPSKTDPYHENWKFIHNFLSNPAVLTNKQKKLDNLICGGINQHRLITLGHLVS